MKVIIFDNSRELAKYLANRVEEVIKENPNTILGLATGSSPVKTYAELIKKYNNGLDFSHVTTFNLDEYIDCSVPNQTYAKFMNEFLFDQINVKKENIHFPNKDNPEQYDEEIKNLGGIDLQILGIGLNGHIAFNEPGTSFSSLTHIVKLSEHTRDANKRFFDYNLELVPHYAISMGLKSIMNAKEIYIVACDPNKMDAVTSFLFDEISTKCPASILRRHPNTTVLLTKSVCVDEKRVKEIYKD